MLDLRKFVRLNIPAYVDAFKSECGENSFGEEPELEDVRPSERPHVLETWYEARLKGITNARESAIADLRGAERILGINPTQDAISHVRDAYEILRDSVARKYEDAKRGLAARAEADD
jgi:hypothetical protein